MSAVRNVLHALEPDPRRLATPNLDPRRIAFLVVERARAEAPANFAEAVTDNPDQTYLNVHALRTLILRSLEHLQRVALTEWTERNLEDQRSVLAPEAVSPMELRPDPSNEGIAERLHNLDLEADQLMSMLAAELGKVEDAAPALDSPHPSADGDLEADLKDVLSIQLKRREPGFPAPSPLPHAMDGLAPKAAPAGSPAAAQGRAAEKTVTGETRPELDAPPSETEARHLTDRSRDRSGFLRLVKLR